MSVVGLGLQVERKGVIFLSNTQLHDTILMGF